MSVDPRHDLVHEPDPARERWRESYYFNAFDFDLGLGVYSSIGYRPSKGYSGSMQAVWGLDRPTLFAYERGHFDGRLDVAGLSYSVSSPFGPWQVAFDGVLNDGGSARSCAMEAVALTAESTAPSVPVSYDLTFTPSAPPYLYRSDARWDGLFDGHVDELGSVTGSITIAGETFPFTGRGAKDHSWGVRDWARPRGWRWTDMMFPDGGPEVALWRATFDGAEWIQDGAIFLDGSAEPLESFTESVTYATDRDPRRPASWQFEITTASHRVAGHASILRVVPLLFPIRDRDTGERATMWNDRSVFACELDDGRRGVGSAEFQFRAP